jgi:hypothetical protein
LINHKSIINVGETSGEDAGCGLVFELGVPVGVGAHRYGE